MAYLEGENRRFYRNIRENRFMARISVKYPCGKKTSCFGVDGIVTAVIIRGKNRSYEFSYLDNDGNPTSKTVEECELALENHSQIGFNKWRR